MRHFLSATFQSILCLLLAGGISVAAAEVDYTEYADLLSRYVSEAGVDYAGWSASEGDLDQLKRVLAAMAAVEVSSLDRASQKAFYINLYNAGMLQAVFDAYPIESVKQIGLLPFSVFKKAFIKQGERELSLDQIEKSILLVEYFDPRIHFAVNCASESCPPLRTEPFVGARLEMQLEEQTVDFANSERAVRWDAKAGVHAYSSLFDWYAKDFDVEHPGAYLNRYRNEALELHSDYKWIPYDWALNAVE